MSVNFRGSKTEQNLINSFAGEAQARNRYTYYSKIAKQEGYEQIAAIFLETAENELAHAKLFYRHIGNVEYGHVDACYPFFIGDTLQNLESAIKGEEEEFKELYCKAEITAMEEGFDDIAATFKHVRKVEEHHAKRYKVLYENLKNGTVFCKDTVQQWKCRECGYIWEGESAPDYCPNCYHPKAYFEILCEKY